MRSSTRSGHFAEKFYLGEDFAQREWESLTDTQRMDAFTQYAGRKPTFKEALGLRADKKARAEWTAMQFARVARGDTKGMGTRLKEALSKFLEAMRSMVKKWLGDAKLTTEALDRK